MEGPLFALAIIAAIVGFAFYYTTKSKKEGGGCSGCPHSGACSGSCSDQDNQPEARDDDDLDSYLD